MTNDDTDAGPLWEPCPHAGCSLEKGHAGRCNANE
jgi:hypothetical protein